MIAEAAEREIDRWPIGEPFALAPRMQAITLDVIMAGIFGIEGKPERGHARARAAHARSSALVDASTLADRAGRRADEHRPRRAGRARPRPASRCLDRPTYAVIAARRAAADLDERRDILSLLLQARDRGRRGADRPGAARRAADARARRPRDDRQLARLDLGAAASAPRPPTSACATPSARRRGRRRARSRRRSTRRCARAR